MDKGIESLQKVIALHEEKRKKAAALGQEELVRYYTGEIATLRRIQEDKKQKRDRKR